MPLQTSASSCAAQSPSLWHWHGSAKVPGWQVPALHASLRVQGLPSLQVLPSLRGAMAQPPFLGLQVLARQYASSTLGQLTTVAGFSLQTAVLPAPDDLSQ